MDSTGSSHLCFPNLNSSCRRRLRPPSETSLLYTLLTLVSLLTVTLNLLIIFSISHFQQLHTPTNKLLLSLAVCDMGVGLLVMPIEGLRYIETCWMLGRLMCAVSPYVLYGLVSTSLGHMVLISIVRYLTICDPLQHNSKITINNVNISICLCWTSAFIYNGFILMEHMGDPDRFSSCRGECVVVINHITGTVDLFVTFVGPSTVMVVLYMKVFLVAASQVRVIRSQVAVTNTKVVKSQTKAARTLGILIVVFLMCFCPYFYPILAGVENSTNLSYYSILTWILLLNSCLNPLIYALFYPWFRKAIKLTFTFKILHAHSQEAMII